MTVVREGAGGDFSPCPAGSHPAWCIASWGVGKQRNGQFPDRYEVILVFELPGEHIEIDGKRVPRHVSQTYNQSLDEKAKLRQHLKSWRGRDFTEEERDGFDTYNVVGVPVMITVSHKANQKTGDPYAVIDALSPMPKGYDKPPPAVTPLIRWDIEEGIPVPQDCPKWIAEKIKNVIPEQAMPTTSGDPVQPGGEIQEPPDDLPF